MEKTSQSRRNFLVAAGTGTAAVAAITAATVKPDPVPAEKKADDRERGGYRLTDHVRSYYRTTLV